MADLSPQALAVLDATCNNTEPDCDVQHLIAAALRAVVVQVLPEDPRPAPSNVQPGGTRMYHHERMGRWEERQDARRDILAIAHELEKGANG